MTDSSGILWSGDAGFTGGNTYATSDSIRGTADSALYQSERWGMSSYDFAVPNGDYRVQWVPTTVQGPGLLAPLVVTGLGLLLTAVAAVRIRRVRRPAAPRESP